LEINNLTEMCRGDGTAHQADTERARRSLLSMPSYAV